MSTDSSLPDSICAPCANCGKGGEKSSDLKACTACMMVKYCNRECQIAHRPQHKKACKKRAAELYDEKLFKEHPPREECPICMLPLPLVADQISFEACCGKVICSGCIYAMDEREGGKLCAFCRTPLANSDEEIIKRTEKLMNKGNAYAYYQLAGYYAKGKMGFPRDWPKANELFLKAGQLGCAAAYNNLGALYAIGQGVEMDKKKAMHYFELAAIGGDVSARYNLGYVEEQAGNPQRAFKHFILAAKVGDEGSLEMVTKGFRGGYVTKDDYERSLRAYHEIQTEMKSEERDKAADVAAYRRAAQRGDM
jgi:hypothetical protein